MKAWPAVTELRLTGTVNLLAGVVAIALSLANRDARGGVFAVIGAVWPGVAPSASVALVIIFASALGSSWVLGAACLLIGMALFVESAVAARLERRRGTQLLRVDQRFALGPVGAL